MAGLYIVLEGPEGSGKSTQLKRIEGHLKELNYPVFVTKEPGGTEFGKEIRDILLHKGAENLRQKLESILNRYSSELSQKTKGFIEQAMNDKSSISDLSANTEACLFNADRSHLMDVIKQKKDDNFIILSDRNYFSTLAYQGYAGKHPIKNLEIQINLATGGFKPDIAIVYIVEPVIGLQRARKTTGNTTDRIENKDMEYHKKVLEGYMNIISSEKGRGIVIAAIDTTTMNEDKAFRTTMKVLRPFIEDHYDKK